MGDVWSRVGLEYAVGGWVGACGVAKESKQAAMRRVQKSRRGGAELRLGGCARGTRSTANDIKG